MDEDDNDKVGYRRPPRHSRFKPGQSGNPRGRPKGTRGLKSDLQAELVSRMTIQINGKPVTASRQALMLKTLTTRAAAGDLRAIRILTDLIMQVFGPGDADKAREQLSPGDQAILAQMLGEVEPLGPPRESNEGKAGEDQGADDDRPADR